MTDVFISYKREEREKAKAMAEALANSGFSVWWDIELLPGSRFADEIMAVIDKAKAAIVLWSENSVGSDYVRAEASKAREHDTLVPVRLDGCSIPIPFNILDTEDLTAWNGQSGDLLLDRLVRAVENKTGKSRSAPETVEEISEHLHNSQSDVVYWRSIVEQSGPTVEEFQSYLNKFGEKGVFADLAHVRIRRLEQEIKETALAEEKAAFKAEPAPAKVAPEVCPERKPDATSPGASERKRAEPQDTLNGVLSSPPTQFERPSVKSSGSNSIVVWAWLGVVVLGASLALYLFSPESTFNDCKFYESWCPEMVVVPSGSFMMGSPEGEGRENERPQHRVTIGSKFAVGVYEVTFQEWDSCVSDGGCTHKPDDEWDRLSQPVMNVSWRDARDYVRWLSRKTGAEYRLLSEAEWEYMARAGTETAYNTGNDISQSEARFNRSGTVEVGSFAANDFGLYDVHGNVWEWTQDCWNASYEGAPVDGSAWKSGNCGSRVLRGGSWSSTPESLRSANRAGNFTDNRGRNLGFRVARTLRD